MYLHVLQSRLLFVQATLWSKIFKQEIELGHSEEAYNAMLANPDSTRSDICARQLPYHSSLRLLVCTCLL